jgi:hypothetical protein
MGKADVGYNTEPEALAPFECAARDIIITPLGVEATVLGVKNSQLWLLWKGGVEASIGAAKSAAELKEQGYQRKDAAAHLQRRTEELRAVPVTVRNVDYRNIDLRPATAGSQERWHPTKEE